MSKLIYYLVYAGIWLLASIPFKALYVLADILYILLYKVAGYRKKVTRTNLKNSFPEKSSAELKEIERRFYHYLCDYMLESMKMLRLSKGELFRRMKFNNMEQYLSLTEKYGGIIIMMPHYANFEWTIGVGAFMNPEDLPMQVYKPLKNVYIDKLFRDIRSRFGGYNVPKHEAVREVVKMKRAGKKIVLGLIADQSPNIHSLHFWTTFLHQKTFFMNGGERIAKMMGYPVFYCEIKKERRGYCEATFDLMIEFPKQTADGEITEMFARRVEQTITREPAYWFWSHRRWKHKQEDAGRD